MKYDRFFELAKANGIEKAELVVSTNYSLTVSLFHGEIDQYQVEDGMSIKARGIINGKFGTASCDSYTKEKVEYLVNEIKKNAKIIENEDPAILFEGSPKYKRINTFNKELGNIPVEEKIQKLFELEKKIKELDPRIIEIEGVEYSESSTSYTIMNSMGLKLSQKSNYFIYDGAVLAGDNNQQKSGWDLILDNDYSKVDIDALAKRIVEKATSQLGGEAPESKKYKTVLAPEVVSAFMSALISHADSEEVQKNSSLFIGKLNERVASKKVTIEERPLAKNIFARWFDDEGVATYNKAIIKNGVLQTYLYNLTTAAKENRQSTGNGYGGSKIGVSAVNLTLKPGKKSLEELFEEVGEGVYITSVTGFHAGLNAQSGNFSLQASGFLIHEGKKDHPLDLITVSGNLLTLFNDVILVGNDLKLLTSGNQSPSIVIKKLMVGGK